MTRIPHSYSPSYQIKLTNRPYTSPLSTLPLGRTPAFSKARKVSTQLSYVSSYLFQPNLLAFEIELSVGHAFPIPQSKNAHVPQSKASGFPPYLAQMDSQTGLLSAAQSDILNWFSRLVPGPHSVAVVVKTVVSGTSRPKYAPILGKKYRQMKVSPFA